jgi:hypothetical protein
MSASGAGGAGAVVPAVQVRPVQVLSREEAGARYPTNVSKQDHEMKRMKK